jgi:hypothetical protein
MSGSTYVVRYGMQFWFPSLSSRFLLLTGYKIKTLRNEMINNLEREIITMMAVLGDPSL